ncbi:MAG: hypothetical protein ACLFWD_03115 [Anaerolineales bacterium]
MIPIQQEETIEIVSGTQTGYDGDIRALSIKVNAPLESALQNEQIPAPLRACLKASFRWQARAEISLERSLRSPGLAPQWAGWLLAWDARLLFQDEGPAHLPLAEYLSQTSPDHGRLEALAIPIDVPGRCWGESHIRPTPADRPIVSAMAVLDANHGQVIQSAQLALTGVGRQPVLLSQSLADLPGKTLDLRELERVVEMVLKEIEPHSNYQASSEYRRAMAAVASRRALEACLKGANQHEQ